MTTKLAPESVASLTLSTYEQLYDQAYRYRQLAMKSAYKRRDESDEHKQVVDAAVAGNVAAACAALTHHYEKTAQIILRAR